MVELTGKKLGLAAWNMWSPLGVPIFPCGDNKRPCIAEGRGLYDASTNKEEVLRLFELAGANAKYVGARMGADSKLFAVDFDTYKGDTPVQYKQMLEQQKQLPDTMINQTRSGGQHYIYRLPDNGRSPTCVPTSGVEVKGDGGYIIVPPSPGYATSGEIAQAPLPLVRRFRSAQEARRTASNTALEQMVLNGDDFHDPITTLVARKNAKEEDPIEIHKYVLNLLDASLASNPEHDRHDRWEGLRRDKSKELTRILSSGSSKFNAKVKSDASGMSVSVDAAGSLFGVGASVFGVGVPSEVHVTEKEKSADYGSALPYSNAYVATAAEEMEDKGFLLYPVIANQDVIVLSAAPKEGKTLVTLTLSLHIASGLGLGADVIPLNAQGEQAKSTVIYFAMESQGAIRKRIIGWVKSQQEKGLLSEDEVIHLIVVETGFNLAKPESRQDFVDKLVEAEAYLVSVGWPSISLVVIDTLTKAMPGEKQNDVESTSNVFETTSMLREVGMETSILFVHHHNKEGSGPRGSSNIMAEPDTLLEVRKLPVISNGVVKNAIRLSVIMARAVDVDFELYFAIDEYGLGENKQGIEVTVPLLEVQANVQENTLSDHKLKAAVDKHIPEPRIEAANILGDVKDGKMHVRTLDARLKTNPKYAAAKAKHSTLPALWQYITGQEGADDFTLQLTEDNYVQLLI